MKKAYDILGNNISILILDYNRPQNLYMCLESIKQFVKFKCEVNVLINGGDPNPAYNLFLNHIPSRITFSKQNEGSSLGILRLVQSCSTKYFIFLQSDNMFKREFSQEEVDQMIQNLERDEVGAIDLTGMVPEGCQFSERAFIMKTDLYLSQDEITGYGTGPFFNPKELNSEQVITNFIYKNGKMVCGWRPYIIQDIGKYAIFETPCGGIFKRRCDTHQIWVIKKPEKQIDLFSLNDEEWKIILEGRWVGGSIPEHGKANMFFYFSKELDPIG